MRQVFDSLLALSGINWNEKGGPCRAFWRLASNTILNGVWVARRKRVKHPFVTTSRNRASPACAPKAGPL